MSDTHSEVTRLGICMAKVVKCRGKPIGRCMEGTSASRAKLSLAFGMTRVLLVERLYEGRDKQGRSAYNRTLLGSTHERDGHVNRTDSRTDGTMLLTWYELLN